MNEHPENLDCHRDSWFAGLCRLCGYKVIATQPDVKCFPTKDYWWYCSNKKCEKHKEGQQQTLQLLSNISKMLHDTAKIKRMKNGGEG